MMVSTIRSEGLAHLSYFVSSGEEALVIDPRRDCNVYLELAMREGSPITHILETHRNEDYVIGSVELQNKIPDVRIGHSAETSFKYGEDNLQDEDTFKIGRIKVTCIHSPGHTDDSMCFAISDLDVSDDYLLLFTGDTLFVNEVGRTDLVDIKKHEGMSRKLYQSLHEKILPLPDGIIIHPGHGAGSVCGGAIGSRDFTTLGYERQNNIWLDMNEEDFIQGKLRQKLTRAPYFKRCERLNTHGPPLLPPLSELKQFDVDELESFIDEPNTDLLDTRPAYDFVKSHIPRSISLDLGHMGLFAGWVLEEQKRFAFLLNSSSDFEEACGMLYRVGLDNVVGALKGSIDDWSNAGKTLDSLPVYAFEDIRSQTTDIQIFDVRQTHETEGDYIKLSINTPLTSLTEGVHEHNKNSKIATICPAGVRSTTGSSILRRQGFMKAGVTEEGLNGWKQRGYPTESE
ncbi:MAG: rhodanese-like domain-containing protein [Candidatus Thorarchaeota archaeon]